MVVHERQVGGCLPGLHSVFPERPGGGGPLLDSLRMTESEYGRFLLSAKGTDRQDWRMRAIDRLIFLRRGGP